MQAEYGKIINEQGLDGDDILVINKILNYVKSTVLAKQENVKYLLEGFTQRLLLPILLCNLSGDGLWKLDE